MQGHTVTKRELVLRIADGLDIKQSMAREMVQMLIDEITEELADGNRVEIRDFGIFEVRTRAERKARNPKTGKQVTVPERTTVSIKAGKRMNDRLREMIEAKAAVREARTRSAGSNGQYRG